MKPQASGLNGLSAFANVVNNTWVYLSASYTDAKTHCINTLPPKPLTAAYIQQQSSLWVKCFLQQSQNKTFNSPEEADNLI